MNFRSVVHFSVKFCKSRIFSDKLLCPYDTRLAFLFTKIVLFSRASWFLLFWHFEPYIILTNYNFKIVSHFVEAVKLKLEMQEYVLWAEERKRNNLVLFSYFWSVKTHFRVSIENRFKEKSCDICWPNWNSFDIYMSFFYMIFKNF